LIKIISPPLVTVYITNYNYADYIKKAIDSVLEQSFQDFEIIIIDDGSTDNSKDIIKKYISYKNIKIIFQQNKGLNISNNVAMKLANGKYIMRLDADDFLEKDALKIMVGTLEADDDLGLVFPDYYLVDAENKKKGIFVRHDFDNEVQLYDQPAHGACTMIRLDFLKTLGGYNEKYTCQDGYELWVKFISKYKVKNINKPLFNYRQHSSNLTRDEERILKTRAAIHKEYVPEKPEKLKTLVIIPVRGEGIYTNNLAFEMLDGKNLLKYKIDELLKSLYVKKIVVTSPEKEIGDFIYNNYSNIKKVCYVFRSVEQTMHNVGLDSTIDIVINQMNENFDIIAIASIEYPLISSEILDDAVNSMSLFGSDSLISVRVESNTFYQHKGSGMEPILDQDKFTKLERESLYKHVGGLSLVRMRHFKKTGKIISGKIGHIILDEKSSLGIQSKFTFSIIKNILKEKKIGKLIEP